MRGRAGLPNECVVLLISGKKVHVSSGKVIPMLDRSGERADSAPSQRDIRELVCYVPTMDDDIRYGRNVLPIAKPRVMRT